MPTPTTEPTILTAGESWAWTRDLPDYPASQGWVLKYALSNAAKRINLIGIASGDSHRLSVTAATTGTYTAGTYGLVGFVERGAERFIVARGSVDVQANFLDGANTAGEMRSQARQALDAARAALKQYTDTNGAVSEYQIAGRVVKYRSANELVQLVNYWAGEVRKEINKDKRSQGKKMAGRVFTRFGQ